MKISLNSITSLGIWYAGPALGFETIVKRTKDQMELAQAFMGELIK